jgi:hypothetical protein
MIYQYGITSAAGLAAASILIALMHGRTVRRSVPQHQARAYWIAGLVLLAVGAAFFVAATVSPNEDLAPGIGGPFVAAFLVATGILAATRPLRASRVLMGAAVAAPVVMAAVTVLTFLFEKAEWRYSAVAPLLVTFVLFTLPALVSSVMFLAAAEPGRHIRAERRALPAA